LGQEEEKVHPRRLHAVGDLRSGSRRIRRVFHELVRPRAIEQDKVNYERKSRQRKKEVEASGMGEGDDSRQQSRKGGKKAVLGKKYGGKTVGRVKTELKTVDQIRKARKVAEHRKAKNARPSRKGKAKGRR